MRRLQKLHGVIVPTITPFFADGSIDLDGTKKYAERMLQSDSIDGLFTLGTTGEFQFLSFGDRLELMNVLSLVTGGEKAVTVNIGGLPLDQIISLGKKASEHGFDAVALPVPEEVDAESSAVVDYIKAVADCGAPLVVYWTPMVKKHHPSPEIVSALMKIENFVGFKDSSRDMVAFTSIAAEFGKDISILQGVEMLHLMSLAAGSTGIVGGGLNIYPGLLSAITEAFNNGTMDTARELQLKVNKSWDSLSQNSGFRSSCKQFWKKAGVITGDFCRSGNNLDIDENRMAELESLISI